MIFSPELKSRANYNYARFYLESCNGIPTSRRALDIPRQMQSVGMAPLVEKIISKGNELEIDMEVIVPSIKKYFGDLNSASLVAMIRNKKQGSRNYLRPGDPRSDPGITSQRNHRKIREQKPEGTPY